jgi:hypothetical protein
VTVSALAACHQNAPCTLVQHMPLLSIEKRIAAAFDRETRERFGPQYLDLLMANLRDAVQAMRRAFVLVGVMVAGFLLLVNARNASFTVGPLKLTNISAALTLIPAIVALVGYEWIELVIKQSEYRHAIRELVKLMHPKVDEAHLYIPLTPPTVQLVARLGADIPGSERSGPEKALDTVEIVTFGLGIIAYMAFLVYAYTHLYADRHTSPIAVSASLAVAILFVMRMILLVNVTA